MEAGYDYTLLGGRPQSNTKYLPALFVAVLAGALLITGLAYYGFASDAEAGKATAAAESLPADARAIEPSGEESSAGVKFTPRVAPATAEDIAKQQPYPAGLSDARYWVNPLGYEQ